MTDILLQLCPFFAIALTGYLCRRRNFVTEAGEGGLTQFLFVFAIPALLFRNLATMQLPAQPPWALWIGYNGSTLLVLILVALASRFVLKQSFRGAATHGVAAGFSNTVMLGIPLHLVVLGPDSAFPLFSILLIHGPLLLISASLVAEMGPVSEYRDTNQSEGNRARLFSMLRRAITNSAVNSVRNPIIVAILAGGLWNLLDLPWPKLADDFVALFEQTALPLSMFVLGLSLAGMKLAGQMPKILLMCLGKLFLLPAIVAIMVYAILPLPPLVAALCVMNAVLPTGVNPLLFAHFHKQSPRSVASVILITTVVGLGLYTILSWVLVPGLNSD